MQDLIVSRKWWLRGEGGLNSRLLRRCDGKMCCLGFLELDVKGVSPELLIGVNTPVTLISNNPELEETHKELVSSFDDLSEAGVYHNGLTCDAMNINDDVNSTDAYKESRLISLFAELGYNLTFVD